MSRTALSRELKYSRTSCMLMRSVPYFIIVRIKSWNIDDSEDQGYKYQRSYWVP